MDAPRLEAEPAAAPATGRFTIERLSTAFARLMGATSLDAAKASRPTIALEPEDEPAPVADDDAAVTPRMIVEGMLFVGAADGQPLRSEDMAAHMRNVTPQEVDALVAELNAAYVQDGSAYAIESGAAGHRLQLRDALAPVREKFRGQVRAARLTPAALEVLSVVAYRPGVAAEEISRLRGAQSYAILAQLVRRKLVRVERPAATPRKPQYFPTERFNRLFGVASPADLPRSEDLDDS
jgi:segregation and condensation protein B